MSGSLLDRVTPATPPRGHWFGFSRRRFASALLAATPRVRRTRFSVAKVSHFATPIRLARQADPPRRTFILDWKVFRNLRLDELPQLLNVLVGDMSLIGPRPLLPHDQPANPSIRLTVRPGITGWAQVNGGTLLTPEEKHDLDEWYIRNASLLLDFRILLMTFLFMFRSQQQSEQARSRVPPAQIAALKPIASSVRANMDARVQEPTLQRRNESR